MGLKCSIEKEHGGHCTGYDGKIEKDIHIKKGENAWQALDKVVDDGVWCDSCKVDGKNGLSALHDVVNLTIGETKKAYDPKNLMQFQKRVEKAIEVCVNCHEV